jgi:uroporphyrinogen-III synthase
MTRENRSSNMSETSVKSDMLPLQGRRILVTRAREQASVLSDQVRALGAEPLEFPTIRIVPPREWEPLDHALARLFANDTEEHSYYSWLIFTSANGVIFCCERIKQLGYDTQSLQHVRIAAIGPATAAALRRYGLSADLVPDAYIAESVAQALIEESKRHSETLNDKHILLPRAAEARDILITLLQEAGAQVDEIAAYRTLPVAKNDAQGHEILQRLLADQIDLITFTSSSTVRNFVRWLNTALDTGSYLFENADEDAQCITPLHAIARLEGNDLHQHRTRIACIGPITAQTARECGLKVDIEAQTFTITGLIEAIVAFYQHPESDSIQL